MGDLNTDSEDFGGDVFSSYVKSSQHNDCAKQKSESVQSASTSVQIVNNDRFVFNAFTSPPGTLYAYAMSGCRVSEKTKKSNYITASIFSGNKLCQQTWTRGFEGS